MLLSNMALSVVYWSKYVENFQKLARKSENAVNSNRVLKFIYDSELQYVVANVQASMRDRTYKVEVNKCIITEFLFKYL